MAVDKVTTDGGGSLDLVVMVVCLGQNGNNAENQSRWKTVETLVKMVEWFGVINYQQEWCW